MKFFLCKFGIVVVVVLFVIGLMVGVVNVEGIIKIVLVEMLLDELVVFFVVFDRVKVNGFDYEWIVFFDEEFVI